MSMSRVQSRSRVWSKVFVEVQLSVDECNASPCSICIIKSTHSISLSICIINCTSPASLAQVQACNHRGGRRRSWWLHTRNQVHIRSSRSAIFSSLTIDDPLQRSRSRWKVQVRSNGPGPGPCRGRRDLRFSWLSLSMRGSRSSSISRTCT